MNEQKGLRQHLLRLEPNLVGALGEGGCRDEDPVAVFQCSEIGEDRGSTDHSHLGRSEKDKSFAW